MRYVHADGAEGHALGPVDGGGSLALTPGEGAAFAAASPAADAPLPLAVFRGPSGLEVFLGAVLVTDVSGDALTIAGSPPGYVAPAIQAGDVVASVPLAADGAALWDAVLARPTTEAAQALVDAAIDALAFEPPIAAGTTAQYWRGDKSWQPLSAAVLDALPSLSGQSGKALGNNGTALAWTAYATPTDLSDGLATKQATLTDGSVTLSRLAAAASAGIIGAAGAGAYGHLTLGAGLSVVGGALTAAATSPGGSTTQIQYNDGGAFAGAASLTFDPSTGSLASTGNLNARGAYVEATTTVGVHLGVVVSPRICFAQGGAIPNWQIDASSSLFRWFTPGQVNMSLTSGGQLTVRGNVVVQGTSINIRGVNYAWPASGGTAGQSLKTDGSNNLYWG